ncbi:MAG: apolipoprotein N-acyltransferase [Ignavibacteria bacterium]|nr:apolipoprotein N-acyltransferase [Ignavibacteria bacterium]
MNRGKNNLKNITSNNIQRDYLFCIFSGIVFGISFPPNSVGIQALFAFVPLLLVLLNAKNHLHAFRYAYVMLFVCSLISMYWIGGFTHGRDNYLLLAGGLLLFVHPIFYFLPIAAFTFIRKNLNQNIALFSFPFLWISNEYFRAHTDFAFPWLTIGNTQTYDLSLIQIASIVGVYGISFIILLINCVIVFVFRNITTRQWKTISWQSGMCILFIICLYGIPKFIGNKILEEHSNNEKQTHTIRVAIVQPNIDPWEKWQNTIDFQMDVLLKMSNEVSAFKPDLLVYPETAIPSYILLPNNEQSLSQLKSFVHKNRIALFTGIPDVKYFDDSTFAPSSSKIFSESRMRYNTYNSSMLLKPNSNEIQTCAKSILVPFAERVPYADYFSFSKLFEWGIGISGWGKGTDSTIFNFTTTTGKIIHFANLICFESVFPQLATKFAKNGADFFTVITNDSWWGNTSGVYQHLRFGIFRAIENRKWLVRCANSGISCFIDPYGRIYYSTDFNTQQVIMKEISLSNEKTFYNEHSDWFTLWNVIIASLLLAIAFTKKYLFNEKIIH